MTVFRKLCILFIITVNFLGCSSDDIKPGCFQEDNRKILATVRNLEGTISKRCIENFLIIPNEKVDNNPIGSFFPCNLNDDFRVEGIQIVFSGYIYEFFDTEDICADFFEIFAIYMYIPYTYIGICRFFGDPC